MTTACLTERRTIMNNTYNLLDEKWIPVMTFDNKFKLISLKELFIEAPRIHSLAGEMKSQDLALFRMFESILISVYTRFDIHGRNYEWIETNERDEFIRLTGHYERGDLIETWKNLYRLRKFTSKVIEYLEKHRDSFYLIGENPFYQVNRSDWDALKKTDKNNKERSNPPDLNLIMLINRTICESNNKINVSTPRSFINKNKLEKDELARWLIMYQNFTGTTGKTYADHKIDSASSGWLYKLNPVYARGNNLFETLMLNMVLATSGSDYVPQRPMWEFNDKREYIDKALKQIVPDNVSELYTNWSRVIYVSWDESDPKMYEAVLPKLDNSSAFIEPMTIWSGNTPAKVGDAKQNKAMWRDFGLYINADMKDSMRPRIIDWLNEIRNEPDSPIDDDAMINLCTIRMFNDGKASQTPVLEVHDDLQINEKFLFDRSTMEFWEERIEETIAKTQEIAVKFWCFSTRIATIKYHDSNLKKASMIKYDTINFKNNSDNDKRERVIKRKVKSVKVKSFAGRYEQLLYDRLNEPFKHWLHDLRPTDERDEKQAEWYGALESLVEGIVDDMLVSELSPRDLGGFCFREKDAGEKMLNPFREARYFKARIRNELLPES